MQHVVLQDVGSHRRGDILHVDDAGSVPAHALSPALPCDDPLFLLDAFSVQEIRVSQASPPGEPRSAMPRPRAELDVYGQELGDPSWYRKLVLRKRGPILVQACPVPAGT